MTMDVENVIKKRRSVRSFKPDPISEEDLRKLLDAARWAPSAGNCQPLEMVVVEKEETKKRLATAALDQSFIAEAPVILVFCANLPRTERRYGKRGTDLYSIQDTAASVQNVNLIAHELGYATCWIGAFDEGEVSEVVNTPEEVRPLALVPIGKPDEDPVAPKRRELEDIVHEEKYSEK